jgi:hypothetical protein
MVGFYLCNKIVWNDNFMNNLKDKLWFEVGRYKFVFILSVYFMVTVLINIEFIHMPPIWDSICVFSPAIYLYEHNFDFAGLLQQKGYVDGGPNIHSFSVVTFLTYIIILITKGNLEFFLPGLHFVQFFLSGIALTVTFFAASKLFGRLIASLITVAIIFYPLYLVQSGGLYTEVAGAALVISSVYAWASRRVVLSVLLAVIACMVKSFGIVMICSLMLLILLDNSINRWQKVKWIAILTIFMVIVEIMKWISNSIPGFIFDRSEYLTYIRQVFYNLGRVPDLEIMVLIGLFMPLVFRLIWREENFTDVLDKIIAMVNGTIQQRLLVSVYLIPLVFFGFIATVPLSGIKFFPLVRYYIWVLPLIFIGAVYACKLIIHCLFCYLSIADKGKEDKSLTCFLSILILMFMVNRNGYLYPSLDSDLNVFSLAERSYEYIDYYKIQHNSVRRFVELPKTLPLFVTRGGILLSIKPSYGVRQ